MVKVEVEVDEETILEAITPADAVAIYGAEKLLDEMDKSAVADYFSAKGINLLSEMSADDIIHLLGIANILGCIEPDEIVKFYGVDDLSDLVTAVKEEQAKKASEALKKIRKQ